MKRNVLIVITCLIALNLIAQNQPVDSTLGWKTPTILNITLSQTSFSNWAAGGENSYAINGLFLCDLNYKSTMTIWDNNLTLAYGLMKQGDRGVRKTDDKLEFTTKFGYKAINNWYYSALVQFKTQFTDGFKYDDAAATKTKISTFMSPGYLNLALGMNYAPSKAFSLFIGPISGKSTFVRDQELANIAAFGVDTGKHVRNEFGGTIKVLYTSDIMKNINLTSKLELFSNYMKKPECIDVDWMLLLNLKVNKWISASINLQMLYDDDTKTIEADGPHGAKVQFKEVFGIGLSYKF